MNEKQARDLDFRLNRMAQVKAWLLREAGRGERRKWLRKRRRRRGKVPGL